MSGEQSWFFGGLAQVWESSARSQRHRSLAHPIRSTSASVGLVGRRHTAPMFVRDFHFYSPFKPPKSRPLRERPQRLTVRGESVVEKGDFARCVSCMRHRQEVIASVRATLGGETCLGSGCQAHKHAQETGMRSLWTKRSCRGC